MLPEVRTMPNVAMRIAQEVVRGDEDYDKRSHRNAENLSLSGTLLLLYSHLAGRSATSIRVQSRNFIPKPLLRGVARFAQPDIKAEHRAVDIDAVIIKLWLGQIRVRYMHIVHPGRK
jgi:hypothetical protein